MTHIDDETRARLRQEARDSLAGAFLLPAWTLRRVLRSLSEFSGSPERPHLRFIRVEGRAWMATTGNALIRIVMDPSVYLLGPEAPEPYSVPRGDVVAVARAIKRRRSWFPSLDLTEEVVLVTPERRTFASEALDMWRRWDSPKDGWWPRSADSILRFFDQETPEPLGEKMVDGKKLSRAMRAMGRLGEEVDVALGKDERGPMVLRCLLPAEGLESVEMLLMPLARERAEEVADLVRKARARKAQKRNEEAEAAEAETAGEA
jgi:hypothetical protein